MLEAVDICKQFPGVRALDGVRLEFPTGQITSVVGENGAGKSTLMKILAGVEQPDAGRVLLNGSEVCFASVAEAERAGITLIHQELNLAESLDVAGSVFLGREPRFGGRLGLISSQIYRDTQQITSRLGLDCSPRAIVGDLSLGQRQLVEIARALSLQSRYLIFDEPTSSLTEREAEKLFAVIESLKTSGVGILYISHRLKEICRLSDRVVVLRDGRNAGNLERGEITHQAVVERMVGRELKQFFHRTHADSSLASPMNRQAADQPRLRVRDFRWSPSQVTGVAFDLRGGEVVGMAGLMGAGRTELAETLFGLRRMLSGTVELDGLACRPRTPREAIDRGILLVPEDRRHQGLVIDFPIDANISLPSLGRMQRAGLIDFAAERRLAESMRDKLAIRAPEVSTVVGTLSGGNQQKVVLAKWLALSPKLFILDEPTRGVDVGAKSEIYALIDSLASQGVAVLVISSDLEEILGISDRVLVMHEGRLAGELARSQLSEHAVMHLATGGAEHS